MKHRVAIITLAVALAWSSVAMGSLFVKVFSHVQLAQEADLVVMGTVSQKESVWNDDKTQILTYTTVTLSDAFKGDPAGATVTIRQLGGSIDGVTASLDNDAILVPGEEVVVFLRRIDGMCYLVGMSQGKFSVVREGSATFLVNGPPPKTIPPHGEGLLTLDELVQSIEAAEGGAK